MSRSLGRMACSHCGVTEPVRDILLDSYTEGPAAYIRAALDEPTARAVIERLLHGAIDLLTGEGNPRGCLLVQGALTCGETGEDARQELIERRAAAQSAIRKRFESAKAERDLSANLEPADLARYISTVLEGMAVEAAGGASRAQLERVLRSRCARCRVEPKPVFEITGSPSERAGDPTLGT